MPSQLEFQSTKRVIIILHFSTLPTKYEKLTNNMWCVDYVTFNGKHYRPNSENLSIIVFYGICNERIDFGTNGKITLPGFESRMARGNWQIDGNSTKITRTDTFDFVYNGVYEMDFTNNELILKSQKTTIYCYATY